jgi:hypothetical protein
VWTPEFTGESNDAPAMSRLDSFQSALERATGLLNAEQEQLVASVCRFITVTSADTGWIAGLVKFSAPSAQPTPDALVESAQRDLVRRLLKITPVRFDSMPPNTDGDFRETLVTLCARRATAGLFGKELSAADENLWQTVEPHVLGSKYGARFLSQLGEEVSPPPSTLASDETATYTAETAIQTAETATRTAVGAAQGSEAEDAALPTVVLRKTRMASDTPVDWHAPDSLLHLPPTELVRIYEGAVVNWAESESSAYRAAVISYLLGKFEESRKYLLKCLEFDGDVEEYRHLLAFSLRHLGRFAGFEQIIFGRAQQASDVAELPGEATPVRRSTGVA